MFIEASWFIATSFPTPDIVSICPPAIGPSRRWNPRKEPAEIQHPRVLGNPASRVGITDTIFAKNLLNRSFPHWPRTCILTGARPF